jgi:hypothetical protein
MHTVLSRFALVARLRRIALRYSARGGYQTVRPVTKLVSRAVLQSVPREAVANPAEYSEGEQAGFEPRGSGARCSPPECRS